MIVFDDSEGSCVIPAGAWNMATVEQWISFKGANFVGPSVAVFAADGAVITHLQKIYGLGIEQAGSAPAIIINNSETFTLDNSSLASPDAGPVVRVLGAINTAIVLENQSAINFAGESSGVVTIDAGLSTRLRINGANISVGGTTIVGGAGVAAQRRDRVIFVPHRRRYHHGGSHRDVHDALLLYSLAGQPKRRGHRRGWYPGLSAHRRGHWHVVDKHGRHGVDMISRAPVNSKDKSRRLRPNNSMVRGDEAR